MIVNMTYAHISDLAYQAALAGYVTALVCHAVEIASRRTHPAPVSAVPAAPPAARGGTALMTHGGDPGAPSAETAPSASSEHQTLGARLGRAAVLVTVIGFGAHLASIVARGLAVGRAPWGNMYEFTSVITAAAVAVWLLVLLRTRARAVGLFVMFPVTILVFVGGTVLYVPASSLVPALQSYWLVIHVLAISLSSGALLVSGVASTLYVLRHRVEPERARQVAAPPGQPAGTLETDAPSGRGIAAIAAKLPPLRVLDVIAYRTAIVAFPVYTFAVVAGALWAEAAWGRYWGWDPKETTAFVTWIIYAGYLHARATAGWRGVRSAWVSILGFASILFNLFFVNMVVSGLHSYAGLN